ncbi:lytic murein transglycosylase [Candidatus Woesearchaeota archaeon]|nr:lytic murein transglycosylase [Candidatus Woesearchaeota archaeon]
MNALILALLLNYSGIQSFNVKFSVQQEVKRLEQALIAEIPFKKQSIVQAFNDSRFKIDLNERKRKRKAYNALTLEDYLKLPAFSDEGLNIGIQFLKENKATLASVEKSYNVSRFDIAAIIGLETLYGAFTGNYYVLNQYVEEYLLSPPNRKQNVLKALKTCSC